MTVKPTCALCGEEIKSTWARSSEHLIPKRVFRNADKHNLDILGNQEDYVCSAHIVCNCIRSDYSLVQTMKILDALKRLIGHEKFHGLVNSTKKQFANRKELIAFRGVASMALKVSRKGE